MELILRPLDKNRLIVEKVPKLSELLGFLGKAETRIKLEKERKAEAKIERKRDEELSRIGKKSRQRRD